MPIFDFKCRQCGHKFDLMISNADKEKAACPECGAVNAQQLLSLLNTSRPGGAGSAVNNWSCCSHAATGRCGMHH